MQGQIRFAFSQPVQPDAGIGADNAPVQQAPVSPQFPPPLDGFHPAVAAWFTETFPAPTPAQVQAWPAIRSGHHVLVSAPTGSGKTLTAFLAGIDQLVRDGLDGRLQDATRIIYVSPLKALSNDIRVNLEQPLAGIREQLARLGLPDVEIRTAVRTGDTPQAERAALRRQPPHILVTTPESLYVLLGSDSGRAMLAPARTVIVDEIHAIADDKRGSHLALSLERLEALCGHALTRIGVSATQKPIEEVARFLVGAGNVSAQGEADCKIVDIAYTRQRDLALELPSTPLSVVMSNDQWDEVYKRIAGFTETHRTTLVFVNTRRMAERSARHLGELLGKEHVAAHHGSLSKELRLDAEQRLKRGELKVLVATASLELGIDIGDVDLVCQLGSPRAIAAFLQRAGRAGHHVGGVPKARLFPASRDELVECAALLDSVRRGELDALRIPPAPVDVLAQQIVAEVSCQEWDEAALYDWMRRAWPYRELSRADFDAAVRMVAEGYATRRGARAGLIHRDAVNRKLRGRKGGRMTALMSGGTIPDTGDYAVLMEPEAIIVGSVNEDFAIESAQGDIFQLGNTSYRVLRVEPGRVRVEDAQGAPPTIPFWIGEAPGRTDELSAAVSRLRDAVAFGGEDANAPDGAADPMQWLTGELALLPEAAAQLRDYIAATRATLCTVPTQQRIVLERFFDESGGTQLIIHSPFGSRVNRAWGLALRKRFCRKFNFELQAAATEDAIVLSLSTSHSFPLIEVASYLHSNTALDILVQALLDAPLFGVRWRWNATTALALPRFQGGKKVPPQLQRMKSEDLLASVFPDQVACLENIVGERQVPDHPLVAQTLHDCLYEAMDAAGWLQLLRGMESGDIEVVARDLAAPSPLAMEAINAKPYAFLDDAPLEERRTQAVQSRRYTDPSEATDLGRLDPGAIESVREQAWPDPRSADEMHEALQTLGFVTVDEAEANATWDAWLRQLARDQRATRFSLGATPALDVWTCAERLPQLQVLFPDATLAPAIGAPAECIAAAHDRAAALTELLRARLGGLGPVTADALAKTLPLERSELEIALLQLQDEGVAMQGHFSGDTAGPVEWCERHLLARIHRYTLARLRREIEPVEPRDYVRFLCDWQKLSKATRVSGPDALAGVLAQLEGYEAAAAAWEHELLPARVSDYSIAWLDDQCSAGRTLWTRLRASSAEADNPRAPASVRGTPVVLLPRRNAAQWTRLTQAQGEAAPLSSRAQKVLDYFEAHGASFFDDLVDGAGLLRTELEEALAELVARGRVHCDSFAGLRALLIPASRRSPGRGRRASLFGLQDAGRWAAVPQVAAAAPTRGNPPESVEHVARTLLRRYGVVCWRLLEREAAWLPPWRELVRVLQRLEARGEIRGGRFIAGLSGEQFALPEAIALLRQVRRRAHDAELICVSAADPLNLAGTLLPGDKVPRIAGARLLLRDGMVVATLVAGEVVFAATLPDSDHARAKQTLLRDPSASSGAVSRGREEGLQGMAIPATGGIQ
jgi:ATP-dependent Lhr-like helicase